MKKAILFLSLLVMFACKKKKTETLEETTVLTTTTGGTTTGNQPTVSPSFAADLIVTNTDHNYSYASAHFYDTSTEAILLDDVKSDSKSMGQYPGNEYRYTNSTSNYTGAVLWNISSSNSLIPDTSLYSPAFPAIGFIKNTSLNYDKTQDFTIAIDVSACDSMFITLGTVQKKIAGKSGITAITFKSTDGVKSDSFDSSQVIVEISTMNYSVITVRSKKWKLTSATTAQSHYSYK